MPVSLRSLPQTEPLECSRSAPVLQSAVGTVQDVFVDHSWRVEGGHAHRLCQDITTPVSAFLPGAEAVSTTSGVCAFAPMSAQTSTPTGILSCDTIHACRTFPNPVLVHIPRAALLSDAIASGSVPKSARFESMSPRDNAVKLCLSGGQCNQGLLRIRVRLCHSTPTLIHLLSSPN